VNGFTLVEDLKLALSCHCRLQHSGKIRAAEVNLGLIRIWRNTATQHAGGRDRAMELSICRNDFRGGRIETDYQSCDQPGRPAWQMQEICCLEAAKDRSPFKIIECVNTSVANGIDGFEKNEDFAFVLIPKT
jgi:hypothetical protein